MKKRNLFKIAALTAVFALGSMFANAQIIDPGNDLLQRNSDPTKVVKVIDNKGTVKYIQSMNGITQITSTDGGHQTTTTLQLGGTLLENTYIDLEGKEFGFKDLLYNGNTGTYDFVVIDATGNIKRMAMTDLVDAGNFIEVVASDHLTGTHSILLTGITLESFKTVYVFRNGAKLLAGVDYTISTTTVAPIESTVTINLSTAGTQYTGTPTGFESFPLYAGDRIEVQFIK